MTLPTSYTERKAFPLLTVLTAYFPDAIEWLVKLCVQGNVQHKVEKPAEQPFWLPTDQVAWDRTKSTDECETAMRHLWDHMRAKRGVGSLLDTDGIPHIVKVFWRAGAESQKTVERMGQPVQVLGRPGERRGRCQRCGVSVYLDAPHICHVPPQANREDAAAQQAIDRMAELPFSSGQEYTAGDIHRLGPRY